MFFIETPAFSKRYVFWGGTSIWHRIVCNHMNHTVLWLADFTRTFENKRERRMYV